MVNANLPIDNKYFWNIIICNDCHTNNGVWHLVVLLISKFLTVRKKDLGQ